MQLGHNLVEPFPALTPLTGPHPGPEPIAGVSLDVAASIKIGKRSVPAHRTGFLFTHKGAPPMPSTSTCPLSILDKEPAPYVDQALPVVATSGDPVPCVRSFATPIDSDWLSVPCPTHPHPFPASVVPPGPTSHDRPAVTDRFFSCGGIPTIPGSDHTPLPVHSRFTQDIDSSLICFLLESPLECQLQEAASSQRPYHFSCRCLLPLADSLGHGQGLYRIVPVIWFVYGTVRTRAGALFGDCTAAPQPCQVGCCALLALAPQLSQRHCPQLVPRSPCGLFGATATVTRTDTTPASAGCRRSALLDLLLRA